MRIIILITVFLLSESVMATYTLDCGSNEYLFFINVGHEDVEDSVRHYRLFHDGELIVQSSKFTSDISWVENHLDSDKNSIHILDVTNKIELSISKAGSFLIVNDI